ncbi:ABC transporter [Pilibacter termitis]|uniref:ABC transporter n=1 Tax=Pilibacter termitis TaxID=263852 RepID=A0A1T4N8T7_9ENTE|nr:ABC transporter ATP-binding protein [Pilibacter termitis]SJZ75526.1 ABC transporter [Pilibacter termitis]
MQGRQVIRDYQAQAFFKKYFPRDLLYSEEANVRLETQKAWNNTYIYSLEMFFSFLPLMIGAFFSYQGQLEISSLVAIYIANLSIGYSFQDLTYYLNSIKGMKKLKEKIMSILSWKEEKANIQQEESSIFPIKFENVSFSYDEKELFENLSFEIKFGEKVAIVGESGAGQTTLLKLITGELLPTGGKITYRGKEFSSEFLKNNLTYIRQEHHIFNLTLAENVALNDEIDREKALLSLSKSQYNPSFLENTIEKDELSGGEKSRIELARALYREKDLLLVDEAKAHLDKKTSRQIAHILHHLPVTMIEISHQIEDLSVYDQVIAIPQRE